MVQSNIDTILEFWYYQLFKTRVAESQQACSHWRRCIEGDVGLNSILTVCCSHCHCSRQSVMAIGQSWLADDDGYDTSTPYYHSSVYGWYNGFVWWVRFLSTLHFLHREEELRSMGKALSLQALKSFQCNYYFVDLRLWPLNATLTISILNFPQWFCPLCESHVRSIRAHALQYWLGCIEGTHDHWTLKIEMCCTAVNPTSFFKSLQLMMYCLTEFIGTFQKNSDAIFDLSDCVVINGSNWNGQQV